MANCPPGNFQKGKIHPALDIPTGLGKTSVMAIWLMARALGAAVPRRAAAVWQALRHAGVRLRPEVIRVQREPFESNGERAEPFAEDTRFSKHRLWHVEVKFRDGVEGPLVIGDGRFLGLGIMVPLP